MASFDQIWRIVSFKIIFSKGIGVEDIVEKNVIEACELKSDVKEEAKASKEGGRLPFGDVKEGVDVKIPSCDDGRKERDDCVTDRASWITGIVEDMKWEYE